MKKLLIVFLAIMCTFCIVANADLGPKPSITVNFKNMPSDTCYIALLSEYESNGPCWAWNGEEDYKELGELDEEIWRAFVEYKDSDGYYYLQNGQLLENNTYRWAYMPPQKFKILLYFPETATFLSSDICERKAFDTYYTVNMEGKSIKNVQYDNESSTDSRIIAEENKITGTGIIKFIIRVILTVLIELVIALIFKIKGKKQILLIVLANIVTQCLLNAILWMVSIGTWEFICFLGLEFLVFAIEALVYAIWLRKIDNKNKKAGFYVLYAGVANICSCGLGLLLGIMLPRIF